jgi:hypothetical protein
MKKHSTLLSGFTILAWLLISLIGYLYLHKPFQAGQFTLWLVMGWQILFVGVLLSISGGLGHLVLQRYKTASGITGTVLQVALGLGLLATGTLLVGSLTLNVIILTIIISILVFLIRKNIFAWLRQWHQVNSILPNSAFSGLVAIANVVLVLLALLTALAPPVRFDALTYHLSIPMAYLSHGTIAYLPENVFWGMPQLGEMLYLLSMAFAGVETAPLLGWALGGLALLGILDYSSQRFNRETGWVVVGVFLAGETFASALSWGYVDWVVILYGFAFLVLIEDWFQSQERSKLFQAAVFAGMALSTKYTAGILLISGTVLILLTKEILKVKMWQVVQFGGIAVLIFSPWLIKNLLATGNPIYPLLFPAAEMDALRIIKYHLSPPETNWWLALTLPWQMTIWGAEGKSGPGASIGPLFLGLTPFAYLFWQNKTEEQKNVIWVATIITIACLLVSAIGSQFAGLLTQTRLFFALFPAWAMLAGAGFYAARQTNTRQIRFGKLIPTLVFLPMAFSLLQIKTEFINRDIPDYILGAISRDQFENRNLGNYQQAIYTINDLPGKTKILFLWEARSFSCLSKCDGDEIIDRWYHDWRRLGNTKQILSEWRSQGFTHVLYHRYGADFIRETEKRKYNPQDWEGLDAMLSLIGEPSQKFGEQYLLYDIRE